MLAVILTTFLGCKENEKDGFDSLSIKKKVAADLDGSEWIPNSPDAHYEKIVFYKDVIHVTHNGVTEGVGYHVTNVFAPQLVMPDIIQLRLKTINALDEIYMTKEYTGLSSNIAYNLDDQIRLFYYTRVNKK